MEVAHEALLRVWKRLRGWLNASREDIRLHRRLTAATAEWERREREADFLESGVRLAQYEAWTAVTHLARTFPEDEFLRASLDKREKRRAIANARQTREAALEDRARNRQRWLNIVLSVAVVIALALTAIAFNQRQIARREANVSSSLNLATGEVIRRFNGHEAAVQAVAISPDGKTALSGASDNTLILWDLNTGETLRRFKGHEDAVLSVAISPDGKTALSGSADRSVIHWDLASGEVIHHFSGQTDTLEAVLTEQGYNDPVPARQGHIDSVWGVAFSAGGEQAVSAAQDQRTIVWDLSTGEQISLSSTPRIGVTSMAVSPDGRTVLLGLLDAQVVLLDPVKGESTLQLLGHTGRVQALAFTPDGRQALSGAADNTLRLWDLQSGAEIRQFYDTWIGSSVDISPDGKMGLTGLWDYSISLWDYETGESLRRLRGHTEMLVAGAYFTPDGKAVVSGSGDIYGVSEDNTVRVWDVATGEEIWRFEGHQDVVSDVAFSPDGRLALSGSNDALLILWDVASGQPIYRLTGHTSSVMSVAFSPDGKLAASIDINGRILLWDVSTGTLLRRYVGHSGLALEVVFTPGGRTLLSVADDDTVREWQVDASQEALLDWIAANRYAPELTCEQRAQYRVEPLCE